MANATHISKAGLLEQLLGGVDPNVLIMGMFFAFLGMFVMTRINISKRNKGSVYTPPEFSWRFFWHDTTPRLISSFITNMTVVFISIRFINELLGKELTMFACLGIGLGIDKVTIIITNWSNKARK